MMNTKKLSYLSILFLSLLFLQASPVNAHAPSSVTLDYDFGTQVLTVEVDHGVGDVNTHYIIQIVVEKNSVEFTTRDYTAQDTTSGMSDTFDVPTVDGDVLRVIATCNAIGQHANTITVSDPSITTTTTTTGTASPTGMDTTTVAILAAIIGIGIILLVVASVKRR